MEGKIAKWWMPDDIAFVDAIPHTATGKILKTALREQFKTYSFPERRGVQAGATAAPASPRIRSGFHGPRRFRVPPTA